MTRFQWINDDDGDVDDDDDDDGDDDDDDHDADDCDDDDKDDDDENDDQDEDGLIVSGSKGIQWTICQAHLAAQGQLKIGAQAAQSTLLRYERRRVQISAEGEVYSSRLCWWNVNLFFLHMILKRMWLFVYLNGQCFKCAWNMWIGQQVQYNIIATSRYDIGIAWLSSLVSRSISEMIAQGIAQCPLYI